MSSDRSSERILALVHERVRRGDGGIFSRRRRRRRAPRRELILPRDARRSAVRAGDESLVALLGRGRPGRRGRRAHGRREHRRRGRRGRVRVHGVHAAKHLVDDDEVVDVAILPERRQQFRNPADDPHVPPRAEPQELVRPPL